MKLIKNSSIFIAKFFLLSYLLLVVMPCAASQPLPWQVGFQPAATANMQAIAELYYFILAILLFIFILVAGLLLYIAINFNYKANPIPATFDSNIKLEIIWTLIPCIIVALITAPSFKLLAKVYPIPEAEFTIKITGYQWYWNYNYLDHGEFNYDSFAIRDQDLKPGQLRLLEVDNRLVMPVDTVVRLLVTAADVIHSFALPAAGIKIDAVPGRVNETWLKFTKQGVYYGQCSELCGMDHAFMPIAIEVLSKEEFIKWMIQAQDNYLKAKY